MGQFTVKNYQIAKAPKLIRLLGDKTKPESATHIIEFPGGPLNSVEPVRAIIGRTSSLIALERHCQISKASAVLTERSFIVALLQTVE
jgi:hypothetical protein